jgi:DNA gyrase subunit A
LADDDTPNGDDTEDELPAEIPAPVPGTAQNMGGTIIDLAIEDELKGSYLTYAMSVIVSRALPDVRDGLKPSQRRILVAMNDLNLSPGAARVKCAKISGDTSGNYHPHGESVIYPTLVRMAQEWNMRHLLIDKQGNFGSIAGLPAAAMRYTEARMSPIAALLMEDIKLDTVDFTPTYDERRLEPTVLPSKFPNLLVNGANGIAVGMATSVPPHNLREVCRAAIRLIDEPDVTIDELLTIVEGPDFPTGGIICGRSGIRRGYHTGRGTVTVRARARIEEVGKRTRIVISEIPFQQTRDRVVLQIADMVNDDKIKGISAIRDESDLKEPVRLIIELKRDADAEVVLNQLYKFSPLQDTFSLIFLALVDGKPRTLNLKEMLFEYVRHRVIVLRRRTQFLLNRARQRKHTVEGLLLAHANIDEVIRVIRTSSTQAEAKTRLMQIETPSALMERALGPIGYSDFTLERGGAQESYRLTAVQAEAILRMTLGQLVNLEQEKLGGEYQELLTEIAEYLRILSDEANIYAIIRADLEEMARRYGDDRRTKIDPIDASGIEDESLIEEENMVVTISTAGFIKRTPTTTYRAQRRGGKGITGAKNDDEDPIRNLFVASTHDYLLFFTNIGKVYWRKVYDLPQLARESKGRAIVNVLSLADGETVAYCTAIRDFKLPNHYLIMATRKGLVKKTPLEQYGRPLKTGLIAIKLKEGDELVDVAVTKTGDEILLATTGGMAIRFDQADARAMGRNTSGVKGIKLSKGQLVVGMVVADPDATLLTACLNGYGKRTPFGPNDPLTGTRVEAEAAEGDVVEPEVVETAEAADDDESTSSRYRTQNRGGKGIRDIKTTPRNGPVVGIVGVRETDELLMITAGGKIQRITAKSVSEIGRNTQGVRIMSLDEGDTLAAVVRVPPEEISAEDEATPPQPIAGPSSSAPPAATPPSTTLPSTILPSDTTDDSEGRSEE